MSIIIFLINSTQRTSINCLRCLVQSRKTLIAIWLKSTTFVLAEHIDIVGNVDVFRQLWKGEVKGWTIGHLFPAQAPQRQVIDFIYRTMPLMKRGNKSPVQPTRVFLTDLFSVNSLWTDLMSSKFVSVLNETIFW